MINIDIIQNKEFSMGYPYSSKVDGYFESLTPEFIADYNISANDLIYITDHKKAVLDFDKKLFNKVKSVSEFVQSYTKIQTDIINDYNENTLYQTTLISEKDILEKKKALIATEFIYMGENREKLNNDILQVEELISHYKSQLMINSIVDTESYISNANEDILIIDESLLSIVSAKTHYSDIIINLNIQLVEDISLVSMYTFEEVILKTSFETWLVRPEEYYKQLIQYYKDEYETTWSSGQSLMYDKNNEYVNSTKNKLKINSTKLSSEVIKQYRFEIDKKLKLYTINIVNNSEMQPSELQNKILDRHISYLEEAIQELDIEVKNRQFAIDSIVSYTDLQNYNKYKELIQLKRYYIASNILTLDNEESILKLDEYNNQILELLPSYELVEIKLEQLTYWNFYYAHFEAENSLIELRHELDVLKLTRKGTINTDIDISLIEEKIEFYIKSKNKLLEQVTQLESIVDATTIEKIEANDAITLINSNIFATETIIKEKADIYQATFSERIKFYFEDDVEEYDGVASIISNTYISNIRAELDDLISYDSPLKWWVDEQKESLFNMYSMIVDKVDETISERWNIEFNHEINGQMKISFYGEYLETTITLLYAEMVQYINNKTYSDTIEIIIIDKIKEIMILAENYVDVSILEENDIVIPTVFYDYNKKYSFNITKKSNRKEILKTIEAYLMNNYSYVSEMNLGYKMKNTAQSEQLKIDSMWANMEMKYV